MRRSALARVSNSHTTWTEAARLVLKEIRRLPHVAKIQCGYLSPGVGNGHRRVKLSEETGCLLLRIAGNGAIQEMRVYAEAGHMPGVKAGIISSVKKLRFDLALT